jgi:hypothetical protein
MDNIFLDDCSIKLTDDYVLAHLSFLNGLILYRIVKENNKEFVGQITTSLGEATNSIITMELFVYKVDFELKNILKQLPLFLKKTEQRLKENG